MDCDQVQVSFSIEPGRCLLRLAGAVCVANAEELRQAALELCAYRKDLVVDWSGVTQLDASIAQVLLSLRAGLREQNKALASIAIPPAVQSWLQTAGLSQTLGAAVEGA